MSALSVVGGFYRDNDIVDVVRLNGYSSHLYTKVQARDMSIKVGLCRIAFCWKVRKVGSEEKKSKVFQGAIEQCLIKPQPKRAD